MIRDFREFSNNAKWPDEMPIQPIQWPSQPLPRDKGKE